MEMEHGREQTLGWLLGGAAALAAGGGALRV